jgi:hypothetical protein
MNWINYLKSILWAVSIMIILWLSGLFLKLAVLPVIAPNFVKVHKVDLDLVSAIYVFVLLPVIGLLISAWRASIYSRK